MKPYFDLIKMQMSLSILSRVRYKVGLISDLIIIGGTYVFVYFFGNGEFIAKQYSTTQGNGNILLLIGFIFWQFAVLSLGFTSSAISYDSTSGNIEAKIQSIYPLPLLYFIQLAASLLSDILIIFFILLFTILVNAGHYLNITKLLVILLFTIPSIIGMYGMGLMIGAVVIRQKRIGSLVIIIQTLLLFVSNTLSVRKNPFSYLIPFSSGVDIARSFYMGLKISANQILIYILLNIAWLIVGNYIFKRAIKNERMFGSFDRY